MKAKWLGEDDDLCLRYGKVYDVLGTESDGMLYGVVDETGESYLYPADEFEVVEDDN